MVENTRCFFSSCPICLINFLPPFSRMYSAANSAMSEMWEVGTVLLNSIFFFPSRLNRAPLKVSCSLRICASAPIGAEHPPSSFLRNCLSRPTQISVSLSFSSAQISSICLSSARAATMTAPWAGAGSIQSSLRCSLGSIPILFKPARAKIAPSQSLVLNLLSRVLTLPLSPVILWLGKR